ncbi:MAG: FAD-binding oxidoreductase [Chloroflexi bacterium]|nr:FAD-binding oxidoreductase [Chloroflexota bacterium]
MPRNLRADVAIAGGGIIGCLTAYYLTLRGVKPVVVEADAIASGASGASGGWLTPYSASCDPRLLALAPATYKLHAELAEELPEETGIDHRYQKIGYLRCAITEKGLETLQGWRDARTAEGIKVEWLSPAQARSITPWLTEDIAGAIRTDIEPTVDSYRLTISAAQAAEKRGARIVSGRVTGLLASRDHACSGLLLADGAHIQARATVLAMGPWTGEAGAWLGYSIPIRPLRGQMLHLEPPGPGDGPGLDVGMSAVDLGGSVLPKRGTNTIVGSTREDAGFDRSPTPEARKLLLEQAARLSSRVMSARLARQTVCLRPLTPDQRAYVGRAPGWRGVYLGAGHYSEGIHFGPVSAKALAGLILDGKSEYDLSVYDPERLLTRSPATG